jgi:Cu2+-exporting ATPase
MTAETVYAPGFSACAACAVAPSAEDIARRARPSDLRVVLSLPGVHCAGCISAVERGLMALPGVRDARVNLTLKRAMIDAAPEVAPEALIAELARLGYEAHELDPGTLAATETGREGRDLLMRLGVAGFAMMNIMLLSVAVWSGAEAATRDLFHWISGMIALPTVAFAGQPFFRSALSALRARRLGMDVPISLAIILASAISVYETTQSGRHAYFDAAVMLTFFLLAGRYLDHRTRAVARSAAQELAALEVQRATRLSPDGFEALVAVSDLAPGDLVRVRPGARMPVDGVVSAGTSEIDRAFLTGESLPAVARPGTEVSAGEVNLTGPLVVRVTAAGRDTRLHRIAELVAIAETARTRYTSLADRAARAYSPLVHVLAALAFAVWLQISGGDWRLSVNIAAAVLIITCPCALGLAVPAVVTAASGRLFRLGLLIKSGTALERLAQIDTVVFDKTGTLTQGAPRPVGLGVGLCPDDRADLELAAGLAVGSAHPLARALAAEAAARGLAPAVIEEIREIPGHGIEGRHGGQRVRLGRADWVGAEAQACTATYLARGGAIPRAFAFADTLRPGAPEAVAALRAQGIEVWVVSGDAEAPVADIAHRLGIENRVAGALPEDKLARIEAMSAAGRRVLMVGDGLNDTAALAAAHVSAAPASGLDAARVASDIVLTGQDLRALPEALRIGRLSVLRIRENFAISAAYNLVAVPVALIGLATPLLAALAMSVSSITVTLNAMRLNGGQTWKR